MRPLRLRKLAASAVAAILFAAPAFAESTEPFDCVAHARGKSLRWNPSWQSDQQDSGIPYRIASVGDNQAKHNRTLMLELAATTPARKNIRYLAVSGVGFAAEICANVGGDNEPKALPKAVPNTVTKLEKLPKLGYRPTPKPTVSPRTTATEDADLPFIYYTTEHGWIRGDAPPYQVLTTCELLEKRFRCLLEDKQNHGKELDPIEEEMEVRPR
ncbi:MAG: hypothetical protein U0136_05405 [Bdellovibrionota bacterium]